ncbi:MAG: hypothetical protein WCJ17_00635 [bacterium]
MKKVFLIMLLMFASRALVGVVSPDVPQKNLEQVLWNGSMVVGIGFLVKCNKLSVQIQKLKKNLNQERDVFAAYPELFTLFITRALQLIVRTHEMNALCSLGIDALSLEDRGRLYDLVVSSAHELTGASRNEYQFLYGQMVSDVRKQGAQVSGQGCKIRSEIKRLCKIQKRYFMAACAIAGIGGGVALLSFFMRRFKRVAPNEYEKRCVVQYCRQRVARNSDEPLLRRLKNTAALYFVPPALGNVTFADLVVYNLSHGRPGGGATPGSTHDLVKQR